MRAPCLFTLTVALAACRSSSPPPDASRADVPVDHQAADVTAVTDAPKPSDAVITSPRIGTECTHDPANPQSDCDDGAFCAAFPGGYCAAFCRDRPCPSSARCVDTIRAGEVCLARCSTVDDCRQGYLCDEARGVCVVPGFLGPALRACSGTAPSRRSFGPVRSITTRDTGSAYDFEPVASLGRDGSLRLAWIRGASGLMASNSLGVAVLDPNGVVRQGTALNPMRVNHFDPWVANDRAGATWMAWLAHDGGGNDARSIVTLARTTDGLAWSAPTRVEDTTVDCPKDRAGCVDKPMLAIGPDPAMRERDNLYVFYASNGLKLRRSTDGGMTWSRSTRVLDGVYGDARVGADGGLHVAAVVVGGDVFGSAMSFVGYRRSNNAGEAFAPMVRVSASGEPVPFFFSNPQIALDDTRGHVHVVYTTGTPDGVWSVMLATSTDRGQTFATRVRVHDDGACANHMTPAVAVDPRTGTVHVIWTENRDGAGLIAYTRCTPDGSRCEPNERVSDAPFAAYGLTRHSTRWLGEYNALVIDGERRRLHAAWTQTVREGERAVSRIFYASAGL